MSYSLYCDDRSAIGTRNSRGLFRNCNATKPLWPLAGLLRLNGTGITNARSIYFILNQFRLFNSSFTEITKDSIHKTQKRVDHSTHTLTRRSPWLEGLLFIIIIIDIFSFVRKVDILQRFLLERLCIPLLISQSLVVMHASSSITGSYQFHSIKFINKPPSPCDVVWLKGLPCTDIQLWPAEAKICTFL